MDQPTQELRLGGDRLHRPRLLAGCCSRTVLSQSGSVSLVTTWAREHVSRVGAGLVRSRARVVIGERARVRSGLVGLGWVVARPVLLCEASAQQRADQEHRRAHERGGHGMREPGPPTETGCRPICVEAVEGRGDPEAQGGWVSPGAVAINVSWPGVLAGRTTPAPGRARSSGRGRWKLSGLWGLPLPAATQCAGAADLEGDLDDGVGHGSGVAVDDFDEHVRQIVAAGGERSTSGVSRSPAAAPGGQCLASDLLAVLAGDRGQLPARVGNAEGGHCACRPPRESWWRPACR